MLRGMAKKKIKRHLIRTRDNPITPEIPRDLGVLCRQPGAETNIYISYYVIGRNPGPLLLQNAFPNQRPGVWLCYLPEAARTNHHELGGLKQQTCILSQFWKLGL